MKKTLILISALLLLGASSAFAQNYDKSAIPPYTLPDPLVMANGKKVRNVKAWEARKAEIQEMFQTEMYGRMPGDPEQIVLETLEEGGTTIAGFATRRQVRMWFNPDKTGPKIDWLIISPKYAKGPVPVVILLNYGGNQTVLADPEIVGYPKEEFWKDGVLPGEPGCLSGNPSADSILPVDLLISRGYALVTACYDQIAPDIDPGTDEEKELYAYTKVFDMWGPRDPQRTDNTTSLMAWAWGLRRGMDLIEKEPALDQSKVLLTGFSRLGKAALIAGAFDERFAVVAPVQTGGGGCPLQKHFYGENVQTMTTKFKHWYCRGYDKYAENEAALPFDQHMLMACIAPRAFLCLGFDNPWYDTEGEYLAVKAASPVWKKLYHRKGFPKVPWPDDLDTSAIGECLGYVRRPEGHGIGAYDWTWMLEFSDRNLGLK